MTPVPLHGTSYTQGVIIYKHSIKREIIVYCLLACAVADAQKDGLVRFGSGFKGLFAPRVPVDLR